MKHTDLALVLCLLILGPVRVHAQQHRATRLGHPETRFAPPLRTPEDLRVRFRDLRLRPDIAVILQEWGWQGELQDLYWAAETNRITEIQLPVGARMPFMSTRRGGRPVVLRDVVWAGKEPVPAYAFTFFSAGRGYRCVVPKPCSNFYVEDLGAPQLVLECDVPAQALISHEVKVCFTLRNTGDGVQPRTRVNLAVPEGAQYINPRAGPQPGARQLAWEIAQIAPGEAKRLCAAFSRDQPGEMRFAPIASSEFSSPIETSCSTQVEGISAILLEVIDLVDPIEVGEEVTYLIRVLNQGSSTGTNIRLVCFLPDSQVFVSGNGTTAVRQEGAEVVLEPLPELASRASATWEVVARATQVDDARVRVELSSDQFQRLIEEQESTRQY